MASFNKYNTFLKTQMNGGNGTAARVVDFDTDTIKVMLVTNSYVPNAATHQVKSDITNEVTITKGTGAGYLVNNVAGYAIGATTIAADTGTGTIIVGDLVQFGGDDTNIYTVTSALSGGSFQIANGLLQTLVDNTTITIYSSYTAGGATITSPTLTESAGLVTFDGNDVQWVQHPNGFNNARYAIGYKDSGSAATSSLIWYYDLGADRGNINGTYLIQFNGQGIIGWQ